MYLDLCLKSASNLCVVRSYSNACVLPPHFCTFQYLNRVSEATQACRLVNWIRHNTGDSIVTRPKCPNAKASPAHRFLSLFLLLSSQLNLLPLLFHSQKTLVSRACVLSSVNSLVLLIVNSLWSVDSGSTPSKGTKTAASIIMRNPSGCISFYEPTGLISNSLARGCLLVVSEMRFANILFILGRPIWHFCGWMIRRRSEDICQAYTLS